MKEPKVTRLKLSELTPDPANANIGTERGLRILDDSLAEVGAGRSIVTDKNGIILAGNKTAERSIDRGIEDAIEIESDGSKLIVVKRTDLDLHDPNPNNPARKLAYYDNRAGEAGLAWDANRIAADVAAGLDVGSLWTPGELEHLTDTVIDITGDDTVEHKTLAERFLVPPFSVLDARQGYWQERKRAWLALGIQSEIGRGETTRPHSYNDRHPGRDGGEYTGGDAWLATRSKRIKGKLAAAIGGQPLPLDRTKNGKSPARKFGQDLMRGEHVVGMGNLPINRVFGRPENAGDAASQSGTSIFDPVLCELAYRWFCPPAGAILDPFAGGSVRGIVASKVGRRYTGIDLRPEQVAANEAQAVAITPDYPPRWITGDSRQLNSLIDANDFDFLFTCPPYYDLEIYSDNPADLSNGGDYETFLTDYRAIIAMSVAKLANHRFACVVVGDIRAPAGTYRNFVSDTIAAFQAAGMALYNEAILITSVGSLPIRVRKQFESGRKLGKTHQNVLVFIKGDWRKAVQACGAVEVHWPDSEESGGYGERLIVS